MNISELHNGRRRTVLLDGLFRLFLLVLVSAGPRQLPRQSLLGGLVGRQCEQGALVARLLPTLAAVRISAHLLRARAPHYRRVAGFPLILRHLELPLLRQGWLGINVIVRDRSVRVLLFGSLFLLQMLHVREQDAI